MSDIDNYVDLLSEDFENQYLSTGSSHRRGSESSESSQVSNVAGTRRRSTRGRGSQNEGSSGRTMKKVYPKVRTGCDTCKQRKIKCDEGKPICRNCIKSKRHCAGYHPPQANIFDPAAAQPKPLDPSTEHLFQYFQTETARRLASYQALQLDLFFWQTLVPKLAEECAPIRHAMLALAAMQRKDEGEHLSQASNREERKQAWKQYGAALTKLISGMEKNSISDDAFLVCCLLLILCHLWDFDLLPCFQHVFAGLKICKHVKKMSPSRSPLSNPTDIYGEMMIPAFQHFADCGLVLLDDIDEQQLVLVGEFAQTMDILISPTFARADEAYATMDRIVRQIGKIDATTPAIRLTELSGYLASMRLTLQQSLAIAYTGTDFSLITDLRMLLVHDRAASILLSGLAAGNETVYDQHLIDFEFVVSEMEDLLLADNTTEKPGVCTEGVWMGILPPLFLAATKCRDPLLRQRALDLMHVAPHEEFLWTSCVARQIATEVVRLEQSSSFLLDAGTFHGDGSRINLQSVKFDTLNGKIELDFEVPTLIGPDFRRSAIYWQPKSEFLSVKPFLMPQRVVQACGYSALMISFRPTGCQCGARASPTTSSDLAPSISR